LKGAELLLPYISLLGRRLPVYGLLAIAGVGIGIAAGVLTYRGRVKRSDLFYAACYGAIGLLVGAKHLFLIVSIPDIWSIRHDIIREPRLLPALIYNGFVFYGGLAGAISGIIIYCRKFGIPELEALDGLTPGMPLAAAIGRLGCFAAGCCYGIEYRGAHSVVFTVSEHAPNGVPLFPVQLLETGILLILFAAVFLFSRKERKPGRVTGFFLILYCSARPFTEFVRGDEQRGIALGLSTSQWISAAGLAAALAFLLRLRKKKAQKRDAEV